MFLKNFRILVFVSMSMQLRFLVLMLLVYGKILVGRVAFLFSLHSVWYWWWVKGKIWHDHWCGETLLVVSYPDLFRFCRNNKASVAELMKFTNGVLFWDVSFFRDCHVWDLDVVLSFMVAIYGLSVRGFGEDKMCWKTDRSKGFMVKDYYSLLAGSIDFCFPWKSIW